MFRRGTSYRGDDLADSEFSGTPMVNMKSFTKNGEYRPEGIKFHNGNLRERDFIKPNEIILANTDLTKEGDILGAAIMLPNELVERQVIGSHHTTILSVTSQKVDPHYLTHLINSVKIRNEIKRFRRGATVKGIITDDLKRLIIELPSLEVQKKITKILDKAYEVERDSDKMRTLHQTLTKLVFYQMFGDVRINDRRIPLKKIGDFCTVVNGSTPRKSEPSFWDGDIPWVSPKTLSKLETPWLQQPTRYITQEGYSSCSTHMVEKGSILFSSRAPIGLVAIASSPVCTNQGFKTLTKFEENATPEYMYQLMIELKGLIASMGRGATFSEIGTGIFQSIEVPLPPLHQQRLYSSLFDSIWTSAHSLTSLREFKVDILSAIKQEYLA